MNDLKEDIKILENYIYGKKETMKEQLIPAIENLLKAYKEDEAVIEEATRLLYEDDTSFGYGRLKEINTQEKIKEYIRNLVKGEKE